MWWVSAAPNYGASFLTEYLTPEQQNDSSLKILTIPLDDLNLINIGYIKVDVEGHELEFLKGAKETIKYNKPTMVLEVNSGALVRAGTSDKEVLDMIHSLGYKTRPVGGIAHPLQYDLIAEAK